MMVHGSLFSGIGGFDLAAQWMGWENAFHCEINPFGKRVLKYYWPKSFSYDDITKTDFTIWRGRIDVLSGGFPCQPYSQAGKRLGKEDDRHLWPEMLRAIREIQPRYVVGENVRGLTNWNGGLVFDEVQAVLEAENYEVLPFLLPACAVKAPHRRDRIWFIAHAKGECGNGLQSCRQSKVSEPEQRQPRRSNCGAITSNSNSLGQSGSRRSKKQSNSEKGDTWKKHRVVDDGGWPTQPPICSGNDGISTELDGITLSKHRQESLKGYGNAVVPQLVFELFKVIDQLKNG